MTNRTLLVYLLLALAARGEVRFASVFSDNMVLQRDASVPVWGTATPGAKITVAFADQTKDAVAEADGRWSTRLDPLEACATGRVLAVAGGPTLTNVLVGEVWLASGQSNMRFTLAKAKGAEAELQTATSVVIRLLKVEAPPNGTPQREFQGVWRVADAESAREFSGVAWFFGRALERRLDVPIGLIESAVGGTCIEAWTRRGALDPLPAAQEKLKFWDEHVADPSIEKQKFDRLLAMWEKQQNAATQAGRPPPRKPQWTDPETDQNRPANLYNARIAPLIPFALRGVIWYQGEANGASLSNAVAYSELLSALITDWRAQWNQGDFPFLFAQLPNFDGGMFWPWLREAQAAALKLPNTGMAVTLDVGDPVDIHPTDKKPVGERLALAALKLAYRRDVDASGPVVEKARAMPPAFQLIFRATGGGLELREAAEPAFFIAGADRKFFPARAVVSGETIKLTSDLVPVPVAARYAWAANPPAVLFGRHGLPAAPFRTDEWPAERP